MAVERTVLAQPTMRHAQAQSERGSFAAVMAATGIEQALSAASMPRAGASPSLAHDSALGALALQLDELGRQRVEAQSLSAELAGAWASGIDAPTLAVSMHRQARAMASYNLSVMWGAKLVGVTAGALRQLVAAT